MILSWTEEAKLTKEGLQNRTHQRKTIYNPYKKRFQPIKPRKRNIMPSKLPIFPSIDSTWVGDKMTANTSKGHMRFWLQNCNGLKPNDNSNINHLFTQLHDYGMHYFSFTETNVNVSNPYAVAKVHRVFKNRFPSGRMTIINSPKFPKNADFQPGGAMGGFSTTLNSRFISSKTDSYGRWICHTFRGRNRDISMYTVYRVHNKSDNTAGLTSAWMQQQSLLRGKDVLENPRAHVITELSDHIRKDINANRAIILMGDFNEGIDGREKTHEKLCNLGLLNLMHERVEAPLPKTWNRGKTSIDHVYMTVDVLRSVKKAGFAPFDLIAASDHRGLYFDVDIATLFDSKLHTVEPATFRKLQSSNLKRVQEYGKLVKEEWDNHKLDKRLTNIARDFREEGPTPANIKRLNDIDQHITDIMRYGEKNCTTITRHATDPWSPKLKELAREIRYLTIEIKNTIRDILSISMIEYMDRVTHLYTKLSNKRTEYRKFIKNAAEHRVMHLEERAQFHVDIGKNSNKASEVKRLKNIEQQKNDSVHINFSINDASRGSASYILIPSEKEYTNMPEFDGNIYSVQNIWDRIQPRGGEDIASWIRVTDKNQMEDMLIQWQILHYTQANNTPFSNEFWTNELEKDKVSDRIIEGNFDPPADLPWEAKEILAHMKRSPQIEKEIDHHTTFEDFKKFYRLATESTSSSPSGRHYGHFKALLHMDTRFLEAIHSVLCISVEHDIILNRWKPTISTLIEKINGKPYIHKYRTIHIIESDIQFLSKQIYVLGMMKMADDLGLITDQQYGARNKR